MDASTETRARQEQIILDEKIAHLENNTADAQTTILLLKYQRNAYAPILMLPNELLLEISLSVRGTGEHLLEWHPITQICRHWRTLVVDTSEFWTLPPQNSSDYALLALGRSKSAPLDVRFSQLSFNMNYATVPLILGHMGRIKAVTLFGMCDVMESVQSALVNMSVDASSLESLKVYHLTPRRCTHTFSVTAFRPTSALRRLDLAEVRLDWGATFPLPGLTYLCLLSVKVTTPVSGERFINALVQMPLLQSLQLSFKEKLDIFSTTRRQCDAFLAQVTLPRLQDLSVHWFDDDHPESDWRSESGTIHKLSRTISSGNFLALEDLELRSHGFWFSMLSPFLRRPGGHSAVSATIPFDQYSSQDNAAIIREVILPLSLRASDRYGQFSALAKVSFRDTLNLDAPQLIELFGFLPHLKILKIERNAPLLIQALAVPSCHPPDMPLPFSSLELLEWCHVRANNDGNGEGCDELDEFYDCIMQRSEYGVPIDSLTLTDCCISKEQRAILEGIFVSLTVIKRFRSRPPSPN